MSMLKEFLRLAAAATVLGIVTLVTASPESLHAAQTAYCLESPNHYCVSTEGGGYAYGWACDAGSCQSCHWGGGRCAPFGSGVDIEGYWP